MRQHDLKNISQYPNHHVFLGTPDTINVFSNKQIEAGDTIILESGGVKEVVGILNAYDDEQGTLSTGVTEKGRRAKFNHLGEELVKEEYLDTVGYTEETVFYTLRLSESEAA